jgi:signal transduction histidine kinase
VGFWLSLRGWSALLILHCVLALNHAQAGVLKASEPRIYLAPAIEILEDPSGILTINDVREKTIAQQFKPWGQQQEVSVGLSQSAWWFRVRLSRETAAPLNWLLEIPYTYNRRLDFYAPTKLPVHTGSDRPLDSRPIFHPHYIFPIEPTPDSAYYYFRAESSHALSLPLIAWQPIAFYKASIKGFFVQAMYYGGILALLLYNLALSVSLKDRRFLLYVGFAFFMCLGVFSANGLGRLAFWPEWNRFDEVAGTLFLIVSTILSILFSLQFLQTARHAPKTARWLYGLVALLGIVSVLQFLGIWIPDLVSLSFRLASFIAVALVVMLVIASGQAIKAKIPGISLFIAAWSVFWVGGLIAALRIFDLIPTNAFTSNALQISSAIEMTLFAFALAEMIKIERRERVAVQNDLLMAKQALLENMRVQETILEKTIEERTKELNIALRKEKEVLSQYVRFGSLISHEFRNPLGVINSQATLLRKEQTLNNKGIERVSTIKTAVRRLVKLFDKWLEGDRLETLMQGNRAMVELVAMPWAEQLLRKNASLFEAHDIILSPKNADVSLYADPDMLEIAVLNLLENACKYSSPGSRIVISAINDQRFSGISVTDEGIGISESDQAKIFDDYVRVENPNQPGLGLGLAFVKRIMQAHAGHVSVTSAPGLGSTFTLFFPQLDNRS